MSSSDVYRIVSPLIWGYVTAALAIVFVVLRFISRGYLLSVVGPTDWAIAFSLALSLGNTAVSIIEARQAYGLHIWEVAPEQLIVYYQMIYASLFLFGLGVITTKISVLLLFLDVFTSTTLRRITKAVLAVVVIFGTWTTLSNAFFCTPVSAFWDFTLPRDRCFSKIKWFIELWIHIALDFVIFLVPIPVIRSMTLPWRQKFWLLFVFALGFAVCLVASIRLYYMYRSVRSPDPTYDGMVVVLLCFMELNLSIVIPCIITLKPLVDKLFPRLLRKDSSHRLNFDGSPIRIPDGIHPPTISSAPPRRPTLDPEMQEV